MSNSAFSEMMPEEDNAEWFGDGYKVISRATREANFDRNVRLGKLILVEHLAVRNAAQIVGVHNATGLRLLQRLAPRELGRIVPCARCSKAVRCGPHTFQPRRYCDDCRVIVRRMSWRAFKQRNKDQIRESRKDYYRRTRAERIAKSAQWAKANPEKKRAKDRRYRQRHLEEMRARDRARSATRKSA